MPRLATPLTELKINRARPQAAAYSLPDGNGLRLDVSPAGTKTWVVRYRMPGAANARPVTIGNYPAMGLLQARARAEEIRQAAQQGEATEGARAARRQTAQAVLAQRQAEAQAESEAEHATFKAVAERWLAAKRPVWSDSTYAKARLVVRSYFEPEFGSIDIRELKTRDVHPLLMRMFQDTPTLARKARQYACQIVQHAILEGLRPDESRLGLERIFPHVRGGSMPAVTDSDAELGELMRAINAHPSRVVRAALLLTALTAVRPGNVASAQWSEIDPKAEAWNLPAGRMKTRQPFTTPLSRQAMTLLAEMHRLKRDESEEYVFPPLARQRSPHLSRDALSKAMREMGFRDRHTPHGFRATLRTLGRERLGIDIDVLEAQLAHAPKDEVQAAYARVKFVEKRREVMQAWADYLDELRDGGNVVPLKRKAAR